jgi:KDO2-lipid IV(A) lauroyltransferase
LIFLLKIISQILNVIPDSILNLISRALAWFFFRVIRFRRKVIEDNLVLAFGSEKTLNELSKIAAANYLHYAEVIFEILRSITWTENQYLSKTVLIGKENLEPLLKAKKGGVFLATHLGNWEFAISTVAVHGVPVDVVVKKSKSSIGQKFLDCYRNRFGVGIFFETRTVKEIFVSISTGRFTGFVLDQFMGPPIGVPVNFFGHKAGTAAGLALFCEKRDLPIFPAYNYRDSEGKMVTVIEPQIEYGPLAEDRDTRIYQRTQIYNDVMERIIRRHPEQWLWLHRRWKEFRGESRWVKKNVQTTFLLALIALLAGCASQPSTPTGIALPPDPQISAPIIQAPLAPEQEPNFSINKNTKEVFKVKPSGKKGPEMVKIPESEKKNHFHIIPADQIPFEVGERIEMDLRWLAIPAGKAVLEVKEGPVVNGRPTFQLWGNVLSSKIVDAIYHVDNTVESFIDREALLPYKFLLHMVESKQNKETRVVFDHTSGKAYYWAKRISERWGNLDVDRVDALVPEAKDLWSAIYYARYLNYKLNEKQRFFVYENGQNWAVELTPVANELVTSRVGAFQCWKILVSVSLNNILKPMGDVYMWLSDDSKKHLVKFDAKIKIGSLYGVLSSIKEH